ncbi:rare lipoprotein A [Novosphingobium kunmingense]|uniref:Rare lipoprotein A n=1 Tax=Novosphingobium kunmingense TaxID=1211806 RepID=A0A2N0I2S7_9SPHN|nr:SPOR domain-containing protein [Novosphingobium kunmingense]PKB25471.1 rare lipoprotein A [Novosphingobium kunmingense]
MRLPVNQIWPLGAALALSACGGGASVSNLPLQAATGPAADYPMVLGAPFTIDGTTYTPADTLNYDAVGYAAAGTAGGSGVTGAHRTLPLPSYAEVTSLATGRTILIRLERRGPMHGAALIELSPAAADLLDLTGSDRVAVRMRRTNPPETERALLREGRAAPARMDTPKSLLTVLQRRLDQQGSGPTRNAVVAAGQGQAPLAVPQPKPEPARTATPVKGPVVVSPDGPAQGWYVQIGAFSSKANAAAAAARTGASVVPAGKLWRVRAGPYADADKARPALAKVKAAGYTDAIIQRAG